MSSQASQGNSRARWWRGIGAGMTYVVGYILLDFLSFIEPYNGMDITPWSPAAGLTVAFATLWGWRIAPIALLMPLAADGIVRHFPFAWTVSLLASLAVSGSYVSAGLCLRASRRFDAAFQSLREVTVFEVIVAIATGVSAFAYVGILYVAGVLGRAELVPAGSRLWIGDLVGILIVAPLVFFAATGKLREQVTFGTLLGFLCIAAILLVGLTLFEGRSPVLLFLLIVPILWLALRERAPGAALALAFAQAGLVIVLVFKPSHTNTLEDFEVMMVVLSLTSLMLAGMSAEHQAILVRAKDEQLALSQRLRTRFTTEVAAMLSHELNQPLTAMKMYLGVLASSGSGGPVDASRIVSQLNGQLERTENILRSVRDLAEASGVRPEQLDVEAELMAVMALLRDQARKQGVKLETRIKDNARSMTADPVQLQQAIYNLVLNAIESLTEAHRPGTVTVSISRISPDLVEVSVSDTGSGFSKDMLATGPTLFRTSKRNGTGVGLSLVRSIAVAHGGTFSLDNLEHGAAVRFTMLQQRPA